MPAPKFIPPQRATMVVDGTCPFCEGTYAVMRDDDDTDDPFLTHTNPPCPQFVEFEPDVYLRCIWQGVN